MGLERHLQVSSYSIIILFIDSYRRLCLFCGVITNSYVLQKTETPHMILCTLKLWIIYFLNLDIEVTMTKWKSLRDGFQRASLKQKTRSGQAPAPPPTYPWYNQLLWLRDHNRHGR